MKKEIVIEIVHDNMQIDFYFSPLRLRLCLFLLFDTLDYELFRSIMFLFSLYVSLIHYQESWDHYYLAFPSISVEFLSYFRFRRLGHVCFLSPPSFAFPSKLCNHRREAAPLNWYLMYTICKTKEIFTLRQRMDRETKQCINQLDMKLQFLENWTDFKWKVWGMMPNTSRWDWQERNSKWNCIV